MPIQFTLYLVLLAAIVFVPDDLPIVLASSIVAIWAGTSLFFWKGPEPQRAQYYGFWAMAGAFLASGYFVSLLASRTQEDTAVRILVAAGALCFLWSRVLLARTRDSRLGRIAERLERYYASLLQKLGTSLPSSLRAPDDIALARRTLYWITHLSAFIVMAAALSMRQYSPLGVFITLSALFAALIGLAVPAMHTKWRQHEQEHVQMHGDELLSSILDALAQRATPPAYALLLWSYADAQELRRSFSPSLDVASDTFGTNAPTRDFESLLRDALNDVPLLRIGGPTSVDIGGAVVRSGEWESLFVQLASAASIVVVVPGTTPSIKWELEWLVTHEHLEKTCTVIPPEPLETVYSIGLEPLREAGIPIPSSDSFGGVLVGPKQVFTRAPNVWSKGWLRSVLIGAGLPVSEN